MPREQNLIENDSVIVKSNILILESGLITLLTTLVQNYLKVRLVLVNAGLEKVLQFTLKTSRDTFTCRNA